MSENYVVFIEQPIKMDLFKIVTGKLRGKSLNEGIYWDPNQETMFHLIDKQTGKVRQLSWQVSQGHNEVILYLFTDCASYGSTKSDGEHKYIIRLYLREKNN